MNRTVNSHGGCLHQKNRYIIRGLPGDDKLHYTVVNVCVHNKIKHLNVLTLFSLLRRYYVTVTVFTYVGKRRVIALCMYKVEYTGCILTIFFKPMVGEA
jgi:hypothetical protein